MEKGIAESMKKICFLFLTGILFVSCESDLDNSGIDFTSRGETRFTSNTYTAEFSYNSEEITSVQGNDLEEYLFGVYEDEDFGKVTASFVAELVMPSNIYRSENDLVGGEGITVESNLEEVVLYLPYKSTLVSGNESTGEYTYTLDSIYGNASASFDFEVHRLGTFLNPLNPEDPSKANVLYSDKTYAKESLLATVIGFVPNVGDVEQIKTIITRNAEGGTITEEVSLTDLAPRIAVRLDIATFQENILDKLPLKGEVIPDNFSVQKAFSKYFNGIHVEVTSEDGASMFPLSLSDAFVEMYYSNTIKGDAGGDVLETGKTMKFELLGVTSNVYKHTREIADEADKIYVQGTAGYQATIEFPNLDEEELSNLRSEKWLIADAVLKIYVAKDASEVSTAMLPERLFLYNGTDEIPLLDDYLATATSQGFLGKDDLGYYYSFKLTQYISNLLDSSSSENIDELVLRVYNDGDAPTSATDTQISTKNWYPKGVILYGGTEEKKATLKIKYSKLTD